MESVTEFFSTYKYISVIVHVFSVIAGMGAALVSDVLFNVFIKDKKINPTENKVLSTLSSIVWVSLIFIVLSGIALFLSNPSVYAVSTKFLAKMSIVGFIILNGMLFQSIVHPALSKMNFKDVNPNHKYVKIRKWSFAFGAISVVSWLSAFILGSFSALPFAYHELLGVFFFVIAGAVIVSQVIEHRITSRQ